MDAEKCEEDRATKQVSPSSTKSNRQSTIKKKDTEQFERTYLTLERASRCATDTIVLHLPSSKAILRL